MVDSITAWATRHGVSPAALDDLRHTLTGDATTAVGDDKLHSEAGAQSAVRLEASRAGIWLGRNNVGAAQDPTGRWIRYGLANDSKQMNQRIKSGDLIGIRPVIITSAHVGSVIGQFVSREIKRPGWRWHGDDHEQAQLRWAMLVLSLGGDACFATGPGTLGP